MNKASQTRRLRTLALCALGVIFIWKVGTQSFAAYLADVAPQTTLWLQQPSALVNVADQMLNTAAPPASATEQASPRGERGADSTTAAASSAATVKYSKNLDNAFSAFESVSQNQSVNRPILPDDASVIRTMATTALLNDPLNVQALKILGQLAEAGNEDTNAAKFMDAAARLSLHQGIVDYWLMRKSFQALDYKSVVYYADVLLRTTPELGSIVMPLLARVAEDRNSAGLLKAALADDPPWRATFFEALPQNMTDARTPLDLLLALRKTSKPPTTADIGSYINFLISRHLYDVAYYTWLQFLPPEELRHAGLLFNGSFKVTPSGLPFDWMIAQGPGVTVDIVPNPDETGASALLVDFQYGRVDYRSVTQLVMLGAGTYEFTAKYKGQLVGPRGLKWRIICAGEATTPLGESPTIIGTSPGWKTVAFNFTVPTADCRAQFVRLDLDARMASEQLVSGSVLFDRLRISRTTKPS